MKITATAIAMAAASMLAVSCEKQAPAEQGQAASTPAENLRARLETAAAEGHVLFGHHDDPVYGHSWNGDEGRSDVLEVCGAYPAVMNWDLGGLENGDAANLDSVPFDRMKREILAQDARGGVNSFSWHLRHPLTNVDSWGTADTASVSALVHTPEGRAALEKSLDAVADFFLSLKNSDGEPVAVIFRPWHEHTGGWFWWGIANSSVDDYKELWKITRGRFDAKGVDNVLWAYSPDRCDSPEKYMERYPGDEYVDILGADIYHFGGVEGTPAYFRDALNTLGFATREAARRGKIAAFTETGCESVSVPDWYTECLLPILSAVPVSYVTVWRNAHDKPQHFYAPYAGHPSCQSFVKFYNNPVTVFVK